MRGVRSVAGLGDATASCMILRKSVAGRGSSGLLFFAAGLVKPSPVNIQLCIYEYPVQKFVESPSLSHSDLESRPSAEYLYKVEARSTGHRTGVERPTQPQRRQRAPWRSHEM